MAYAYRPLTHKIVRLIPRVFISYFDYPSVVVARSPAQEAPPVRQKHAGAAGLQESRHRYGLGVPKVREERVTIGVHDKTDPFIERTQFEGVAIRKLDEDGAGALVAANFGQHWSANAMIISDFSSAACVNTCIREAQT